MFLCSDQLSPLERKALEVEVDYYQLQSLKELLARESTKCRFVNPESKLLSAAHAATPPRWWFRSPARAGGDASLARGHFRAL